MKNKLLTTIIMIFILGGLILAISNFNYAEAAKIIENGIYRISMFEKENNHLSFEIENNSKKTGANVQLGEWKNINNEKNKFKITADPSSEYYTIESVLSNKVLDVQHGGNKNGTNVWQYTKNNTDAQKWKIEKNNDGSYSFKSKKNNLYLDIKYGEMAAGANLQIYEKNGTNAQKFNITKIGGNDKKTLSDGIYRIVSSANNTKSVQVANNSQNNEANVELADNNVNGMGQKFEFKYNNEDGCYTIKNILSQKNLDSKYASVKVGTNIWQYEENYTDAQRWEILKNTDGTYSFVSKRSGLYIDIKGNNVELNTKNDSKTQRFELVKVNSISEKTVENGTYKIETMSGKVIAVDGESKENSANIVSKKWKEYENQSMKFNVQYENGYYVFKNLESQKLIDSKFGDVNPGTNVWQYEDNGTDAQRWIVEKNSDNTYGIICKKSGLYLTEVNGNMELANVSGNNNQKFKLTPVSAENKTKNIENGTYKIVSAANNNVSIGIKNASQSSMANIQLESSAEKIINEFNISKTKDGYYEVYSINSGMSLDVQYAGMTNGTNVWQYQPNGTDAQKWKIRYNEEDDTYSFVSKLNSLYIDAEWGKTEIGTNIQLFEGNGTKAQRFKLVKQDGKTEKNIGEGRYKVTTKLNNTRGLDIEDASDKTGAVLQVWQHYGYPQQVFEFKYSNGYYHIINANSNKALQVEGNKVKQYPFDENNENQKWILRQYNGYYNIISKSKNLSMNLENASNGTDINLANTAMTNNQLFKIEKIKFDIDTNKYPGIKERVEDLQAKHPKWDFEVVYTGINFSDAVDGEYNANGKRNCLVNISNYQGEWIANNPYKSGNWYSASKKGIAYFMDPRNFLNEIDVFQFLDVNEYAEGSVTLAGIEEQVKNSFLQNYAKDINNACIKQQVNPYYVIARLFQEQGRQGTTIGKGMDGGDGKTYYNPFNIGAVVGNDYATALAKAKEKGWDSMEKAIYGGIDFLKEVWLENFQNTLYQNKFDIDSRNGSPLYQHEYMQNLSAAYSEARILRDCYSSTETINSNFKFIIPVYENMPRELSPRPSNRSNTLGPKDAKIVNKDSIEIKKEAKSNSETIGNVTKGQHVISTKREINGNWNQIVTDDGTIGYIQGDYIEYIPDVIKCEKKKRITAKSGLKVRNAPGINMELMSIEPYNSKVTSIHENAFEKDGYLWDRVILSDGRQVYAPSEYLENV